MRVRKRPRIWLTKAAVCESAFISPSHDSRSLMSFAISSAVVDEPVADAPGTDALAFKDFAAARANVDMAIEYVSPCILRKSSMVSLGLAESRSKMRRARYGGAQLWLKKYE